MRRIATALNESQYKLLDNKLKQVNMSEYEFLKLIVLAALEPTPENERQAKVLLIEAFKEAIKILDNAP